MTIEELYQQMGASYDQAKRVLRVDRLIDKHIRKMPTNGVMERLIEAGKGMDATELFESAHAAKGICGNLGLTVLAEGATKVAEEFRPGNPRTMSDEQVKATLDQLATDYAATLDAIAAYAAS